MNIISWLNQWASKRGKQPHKEQNPIKQGLEKLLNNKLNKRSSILLSIESDQIKKKKIQKWRAQT